MEIWYGNQNPFKGYLKNPFDARHFRKSLHPFDPSKAHHFARSQNPKNPFKAHHFEQLENPKNPSKHVISENPKIPKIPSKHVISENPKIPSLLENPYEFRKSLKIPKIPVAQTWRKQANFTFGEREKFEFKFLPFSTCWL